LLIQTSPGGGRSSALLRVPDECRRACRHLLVVEPADICSSSA
jgi:hypothetical protein